MTTNQETSLRELIEREAAALIRRLAARAEPQGEKCPHCGAPCRKEVLMRGGDNGWGDDESRTVYRFSPPADRAPGGEVTEEMVRKALHFCPTDLSSPARWRWIAENLSAQAAGEGDALRRELIRVYRSIGNDLMAAEHEAALAARTGKGDSDGR